MDAADHEDIRKHVRIYVTVFVALAVLTVVTVLPSYLNVSTPLAVVIALFIATIKGTLVASYFMHLISEKRTIFGLLILSAVFLIVMLLIPALTDVGTLVSGHVS